MILFIVLSMRLFDLFDYSGLKPALFGRLALWVR